VKKPCVSCGKQIPSVALNCVFCSARQPPPDFGDLDVLRGAVERAKEQAAGGMFDEDAASKTEHTLVGLRIADLGAAKEAPREPAPTNGSAAPGQAVAAPAAVREAPATPAEGAKAPEAKAPEALPSTERPTRELGVALPGLPWAQLGRGLMGSAGAVLMVLFFLPWHGVSSWHLLDTLAGADFVRQLFYLAGGIVLVATALLPLPFAFRAVVGAAVAATPVVLGARGVIDGWRGVIAALAILGLPATHLLRSRAQSSTAARALVAAAVAAVVLLYLAPISSVVPIAAVLKMITSGSIGLALMGLCILVPLGFAALSLLGLLGRDFADIEVLLSVLILLWAPVVVALRGLLMDDSTQLYIALALLWASATSALSLAQLLSLAASRT
jgi:hypothetical protein